MNANTLSLYSLEDKEAETYLIAPCLSSATSSCPNFTIWFRKAE